MDKEEKIRAHFYAGIFMIVTAVCYFGNDSLMLSMLFGILACAAVAIIKWVLFLPAKLAKDAKTRSIQFYEKCVENGIHDLDSEKNRKRAELIARELGCDESGDLQKLFEKGRELSLQAKAETERKVNNARIAQLAEQEKQAYAELTKYANCIGNEKTIRILSEEISALRSRYETLSNFGEKASSVLLEREKDWATAGGIASGIAGGAAGVATALNVQAENAEIRARNAQKTEMITNAQMYLDSSGKISNLSNQIANKQRILDKEKLKLVADIPAETIIQHLQFKKTSVEVSETGAFRVKTRISMKEPLIIYEDLSARIDGTLVCTVSQNGQAVGTAELVLPLYGVHPSNDSPIYVEGICLRGAIPNVPCTYSFSGQRLYAIEN